MTSRHTIPELYLERVAAGESSPAEHAKVAADPEARARLEALRVSNLAFHREHDPEWVLRRIRSRAVVDSSPARSPWWPVVLVALPALALAVVLVRPSETAMTPPGPGLEASTAKGLEPALRVAVLRSDEVSFLVPDATVQPGDEVQLSISAGDALYGVVVSLDGQGGVTRHFPVSGADTRLPQGEQPLDQAFVLDDAPGFERFVLVTDDRPIDVERVLDAARRTALGLDPVGGALPVPESLDQTSFTVHKGHQ
jgi:hypothetical protein